MALTASMIYAKSQGAIIREGSFQCHWCAAPCSSSYLHDDYPRTLDYPKNKWMAKRPGEPYICIGCWLYHRKRLTISFLDGKYEDVQCPMDHSWWITERESFAISESCYHKLLRILLRPPRTFVLGLKTKENISNLLHLFITNDVSILREDTPLFFTLNNIPHEFNTYELKEALRGNIKGRVPGVSALLNLFGSKTIKNADLEGLIKRKRGRPKIEDEETNPSQKIIAISGLCNTFP